MTNIVIITDVLVIFSIDITKMITDVWAWEKYYKEAEVLQRIDVELLPTEAAVISFFLFFILLFYIILYIITNDNPIFFFTSHCHSPKMVLP